MSANLAAVLIALHGLAAAVWVGGMFFAYMSLRPVAATQLDPPQRTRLWEASFQRFFPWVWGSVFVLPGTGLWLIFGFYGGMANVSGDVHTMLMLGIIMMTLFAHIYFAPYRRMRQAIAVEDWPEAGRRLGQIRLFIAINLVLGLITVAIGAGGRFW
jgi:uncharacterized membrane protein